jgi:hypothetical protein
MEGSLSISLLGIRGLLSDHRRPFIPQRDRLPRLATRRLQARAMLLHSESGIRDGHESRIKHQRVWNNFNSMNSLLAVEARVQSPQVSHVGQDPLVIALLGPRVRQSRPRFALSAVLEPPARVDQNPFG